MKTDEELESEALEMARKIWENPNFSLPYTYCSRCEDDPPMKQRCVCFIATGEALCARHWIEDKVRQLKEAQPVMTVKLDLADFAKI